MPPGSRSTIWTALALALLVLALGQIGPAPAADDAAAPAEGGAEPLASGPAEGDPACTGQRFIGQHVACFSDRAVLEDDPRICLQARTPDVRWPCVAKYAVVAGDAATCGLLPGPAVPPPDDSEAPESAEPAEAADAVDMDPRVTVDLCLTTLALVWRRPALCRLLETPAMGDSCLAKLVAIGGDPALCLEIGSKDLRAVCRPDPAREGGE